MEEEMQIKGKEKRSSRNKRPHRYEEYVLNFSQDDSSDDSKVSSAVREKKTKKNLVKKKPKTMSKKRLIAKMKPKAREEGNEILEKQEDSFLEGLRSASYSPIQNMSSMIAPHTVYPAAFPKSSFVSVQTLQQMTTDIDEVKSEPSGKFEKEAQVEEESDHVDVSTNCAGTLAIEKLSKLQDLPKSSFVPALPVDHVAIDMEEFNSQPTETLDEKAHNEEDLDHVDVPTNSAETLVVEKLAILQDLPKSSVVTAQPVIHLATDVEEFKNQPSGTLNEKNHVEDISNHVDGPTNDTENVFRKSVESQELYPTALPKSSVVPALPVDHVAIDMEDFKSQPTRTLDENAHNEEDSDHVDVPTNSAETLVVEKLAILQDLPKSSVVPAQPVNHVATDVEEFKSQPTKTLDENAHNEEDSDRFHVPTNNTRDLVVGTTSEPHELHPAALQKSCAVPAQPMQQGTSDMGVFVDIKDAKGKVVFRVLEDYRDRAIHSVSFSAVIKNLAISLLTPPRVLAKTYTNNDKQDVNKLVLMMLHRTHPGSRQALLRIVREGESDKRMAITAASKKGSKKKSKDPESSTPAAVHTPSSSNEPVENTSQINSSEELPMTSAHCKTPNERKDYFSKVAQSSRFGEMLTKGLKHHRDQTNNAERKKLLKLLRKGKTLDS